MAEKIKLILFDLDNVLYDYDRSARTRRLSEISGRKADQIYSAIWESGFERLADGGAFTSAEYLRAFGGRLGYPLTLDEWLDARRVAMRPDRAMLDIVGCLRASVKVAILTNNTELVTDHINVLCPELEPLFGPRIYASARFKSAKPDVACYRSCLAALEVRPEAAFFVDDLAENIAGAQDAGIRTHHFVSAAAFAEAIRRDGFIPEAG